MLNMFGKYPGRETRLGELARLVDRMAAASAERYGAAGLDIAALPEYSVSGGLNGPEKDVASPIEGSVLEVMGGAARRNTCYIALPMLLTEDARRGIYSNAHRVDAAPFVLFTIDAASPLGALAAVTVVIPASSPKLGVAAPPRPAVASTQPMGSLFEQALLLVLDSVVLLLMERGGLEVGSMYARHANLE